MPLEVETIQIADMDAAQLLIGNVGSRWDDVCAEVDLAYRRLREALRFK